MKEALLVTALGWLVETETISVKLGNMVFLLIARQNLVPKNLKPLI